MEKYLWLSARDRLSVLLKIFRKAMIWLGWTVLFAFLLYISPLKAVKDTLFYHLIMLFSSFALFAVTIKLKPKKLTLPSKILIFACAGIIIFWAFLRYGLALCFCFLAGAILLFCLSLFLALRFEKKIGSLKLGNKIIPIILCSVFAEFTFMLYANDSNSYILSGGLSLCFVLFNIVEINHFNIYLTHYAIEENDLKKLIKQSVLPFYFNLLGMFVFSDAVRLISKAQLLKSKQQLLP